ncbi:MAG: ribonuclease P protein component [Planctomycetaceae bacterium]|jgi:ribonuclease P protein component|nr:ribonuclease P protein component [Planctomycetaceae bacterium]
MSYRFPKKMRLCRQEEFDAVFHARISAGDAVLVVYGMRNGLKFSRLGLKVSKKNAGKRAVDRNFWKRILREVFRQSQHEEPFGVDWVVFPKQGAVPDFHRVNDSFRQLRCRVIDKLAT